LALFIPALKRRGFPRKADKTAWQLAVFRSVQLKLLSFSPDLCISWFDSGTEMLFYYGTHNQVRPKYLSALNKPWVLVIFS